MSEASQPKISVIVPCYNIEGYVSVCLDSLSAQTHGSFEAVLVDDGSTDGTGQMLDVCAEKDERFRVIHQAHEGPSGARNAGLAASRGSLVAFIDADDCFSPRYLEVLDMLLERFGAEIACCGHTRSHPGAQVTFDDSDAAIDAALAKAEVLDAAGAMRAIAEERIHFSYWSKLMRRELALAAPFPAGMVYEDIWNLGCTMSTAQVVVHAPLQLYCYVAHETSLTRARPRPIERFWQFRDATAKFEEVYRSTCGLEHATDDPSYCLHLVHRLCGQFTTLQNSICDDVTRAEITDALVSEIDAAYQLACRRGVSRTHPQMVRAFLVVHAPSLHNAVLAAYRSIAHA